MTSVTVWLLIAISNASYNRGTANTLATFATAQSCEQTRARIPPESTILVCVQATIAR